jgi:hypothetical protein
MAYSPLLPEYSQLLKFNKRVPITRLSYRPYRKDIDYDLEGLPELRKILEEAEQKSVSSH